MEKISKTLKLVIKAVISCAFFYILLSFVKTNELLTTLSKVDYGYLGISFAVTLIMVLASCAKWKLVLDLKTEKRVTFFNLLKIYFIGYFFSNILPSTVGGDVVRSYYAGKRIGNQSFAAVSVFVERFSGIFFLFFLVALAPLIHLELYHNPYIVIPAIAGLSFAGITLWVSRAKKPFRWSNRLASLLIGWLRGLGNRLQLRFLVAAADTLEKVYGKILEKGDRLREELHVASQAVKNDRTFLLRLVGWTVLFYCLTWVNVYTTYLAFSVHVDFWAICAVVPAIMLVAHVPVTLLGNLGYFESVFVFYFLLVGIGGAETLAMGLLLRIKMFSMGVIGFAVYMIYRQSNRLDLGGNQSTTPKSHKTEL